MPFSNLDERAHRHTNVQTHTQTDKFTCNNSSASSYMAMSKHIYITIHNVLLTSEDEPANSLVPFYSYNVITHTTYETTNVNRPSVPVSYESCSA